MRKEEQKRILLVGTCRSGSTSIAKCFLQRNDTHVLSQVIKEGVEKHGNPDHAAFFEFSSDRPIIFDKEVFGWRTNQLCTFKVLPDPRRFGLQNLVLLFLFRDPVRVWNGWVKRKWDLDINLFFAAYEHLYTTFLSARILFGDRTCGVVLFDKMHMDPTTQLQRMCRIAEIQYDEKMLEWQVPWGKRRGGNTGNPDIDSHPTFVVESRPLNC